MTASGTTPFRVEYAHEAIHHLRWLTASQRALVLDEVPRKLAHQPTLATRNRKLLRANDVAPWELRLGTLRVYFEVDPGRATVTIRAVGIKVRERVRIGGVEIELR